MKIKRLTKKDRIHYVIFKYLDLLELSAPYEHASAIIEDLQKSKII